MKEIIRLPALRGAYIGARIFARMFPWIAARLGAFIWFTPPRRPAHSDFSKLVSSSNERTIRTTRSSVIFRSWSIDNAGPHFVLIHGWGGRWDQFSGMISYLTQNDYRVSSFDFPAHGESSGLSTDLSEWFEVLDQVQEIIQNQEAVYVCHSFGFIAISHAILHLKLRAKAVVAINAPTHFNFLIDSFVKRTNLHRNAVPYLVKNLEARLRHIREMTDVRLDQLSRKLRLLYIADQTDREVPFSEHTAAAGLLKENFVVMQGFGHNRILATSGLYEILRHFCQSLMSGMT
jgi:pimeloyl-ACP methyl ester carboxylesterase